MAVSAAPLPRVPVAFLPLESPQNSNLQNIKNRTKNAEKPPKQAVFLRKVVGVRGLEPRASCSQSRRATNCATPRYEVVGLPGRILPNHARYQLRNTSGCAPRKGARFIIAKKRSGVNLIPCRPWPGPLRWSPGTWRTGPGRSRTWCAPPRRS